MAGNHRIISHNHIIADHTVMRHMGIDHKHSVISDISYQIFNRCSVTNRVLPFRSSGIHGYIFADNVTLADNQTGIGLKLIAVILRPAPQNGSRKNNRPLADGRITQNGNMADELNIRTDFGFWTDKTKRPDFGSIGNLSAVFNNSWRMNIRHIVFPFNK